ncbi:MAG: hypothetical protein ACRYG7_14845 [Janthinobacterium lividum]
MLKNWQISKEALEELAHSYATKAMPNAAEDSNTYAGPAPDPAVTEQPA